MIYSYIFVLINIVFQIVHLAFLIYKMDKAQLDEVVWAFDSFSFALNCIVSSIAILLSSEVLCRGFNLINLLHVNGIHVKYHRIKKIHNLSHSAAIFSLLLAAFFSLTQTYCFISFYEFSVIDQFFECFSLVFRTITALHISGQFIVDLVVIRFCYATINETILDIGFGLAEEETDTKGPCFSLRCLIQADNLIKDVVQDINSTFGGFNLFVPLAAFFESIWVITYYVFQYRVDFESVIGFLWIIYCQLLVLASSISSIAARSKVSPQLLLDYDFRISTGAVVLKSVGKTYSEAKLS